MIENVGQGSVEQIEIADEQEFMSLIDPRLMSEAQAYQDNMLKDIMDDETPLEISQDQQAASPTMDSAQIEEHLRLVHGVQTEYKEKQRRAPLKDITNAAGSSSDVSKKAKV